MHRDDKCKLHAVGAVRRYVRHCFSAVPQHSKKFRWVRTMSILKIHSPCHIGTVFTHGKYCGIAQNICFIENTFRSKSASINRLLVNVDFLDLCGIGVCSFVQLFNIQIYFVTHSFKAADKR